jgi:hypothetical protein
VMLMTREKSVHEKIRLILFARGLRVIKWE